MTSSYYSNLSSTQNNEVVFLLFGRRASVLVPRVWDEPNVSSITSNLTNLVDFQRLHENIK